MGNVCGDDQIYNEVKLKNPNTFQKFIIENQLKIFINSLSGKQIDDIHLNLKNQIAKKKSEDLKEVDIHEEKVKQHLEVAKGIVDVYLLGGIKSFEQIHQVTIDHHLGFTSIHNQFQTIRKKATQKYQDQEYKLHHQIDQLKSDQASKVNSKKEKLKMFYELQPSVQKDVYLRGAAEFKPIVQSAKSFMKKSIQPTKLSTNDYLNRFQNIIPIENLENLVKSSKLAIDSAAFKLTGDPAEGKAILF